MFYNTMFLKDTKDASHLRSTMTDDEYLDAFSAPRIDPTRMGRKVLMTKPKPESEVTSDDDDLSSLAGSADGEEHVQDDLAEKAGQDNVDEEAGRADSMLVI